MESLLVKQSLNGSFSNNCWAVRSSSCNNKFGVSCLSKKQSGLKAMVADTVEGFVNF